MESERSGVRAGRAVGLPLLLLVLPARLPAPEPAAGDAEAAGDERCASPKRNWSMRWKRTRTRFEAARSYSHISSVHTLDAPLELAGPLPDRVLPPMPSASRALGSCRGRGSTEYSPLLITPAY